MRQITKDELHTAFVALGIDESPRDVVAVTIREGVVDVELTARDNNGKPKLARDHIEGFTERGVVLTYTLTRKLTRELTL